jgi:hypothetical protein|tara:strand:- start:588 stop:1175 length:588 start_codon:yes stop_codon:yes gene_type:complete
MTKVINEASMNISMNGNDATEVADLVKLLQNAGMPQAGPVADIPMPAPKQLPVPHGDHDEMKSMMTLMTPPESSMSDCGCDEADCGCDETMSDNDVEEDWENSPDEEYKDHKYMTQDLAGGINGPKKSYKPAANGDNPMAIESIKEALWAALSEKQTIEGRGRGKKKLKASRGNEDIKTTEGSRGKKSRGKKSRG